MHFRGIFLLSSLLFFSCQIFAQTPTFEWAGRIGGNGTTLTQEVISDPSGNVIIAGQFRNTVDLDPGSGTSNATSGGGADVFMVKLDANGGFLWGKTFTGASSLTVWGLETDAGGNLYIAGTFQNTVDFDPGTGTRNLTAAGQQDIYLVKLDASGNHVWSTRWGNSFTEIPRGMDLDGNGNIWITGEFFGTVDFDPGSGTTNLTSAGGNDIFVSKLDANGNFRWAGSAGSTNSERGNAILAGSSGKVFVTGYYVGIADLDPGPGTQSFNAGAFGDPFLLELDSSGNFVGASVIDGSTGGGEGYGIAGDNQGNLFWTGTFGGIFDLDPGPQTAPDTSAGSFDIFLIKLDSNRNHIWSGGMGGAESDQPNGITAGSDGSVTITGRFRNTADFDRGPGQFSLTSAGGDDIFQIRHDANGNFSWGYHYGNPTFQEGYDILETASGDLYTVGNFHATQDFDPDANASYNLTATSSNGDGFIQKLYICQPSLANISVTACDAYTLPSGSATVTASGTYSDTLQNARGCDSLLTIQLTLNISTPFSISPVVCDTFISPSGLILTSSGVYEDTIPNAAGCDSLLTIFLVVGPVDTAVSDTGNTLTANYPNASYQWLNCNNGYAPLPGDTFRTFTPAVSGSYAVAITDFGCTDTSGCRTVVITRRNQPAAEAYWQISPNPGTGPVTLTGVDPNAPETFAWLDMTGRIHQKGHFQGSNRIQVPPGSGLWMLEIRFRDGCKKVFRVVR